MFAWQSELLRFRSYFEYMVDIDLHLFTIRLDIDASDPYASTCRREDGPLELPPAEHWRCKSPLLYAEWREYYFKDYPTKGSNLSCFRNRALFGKCSMAELARFLELGNETGGLIREITPNSLERHTMWIRWFDFLVAMAERDVKGAGLHAISVSAPFDRYHFEDDASGKRIQRDRILLSTNVFAASLRVIDSIHAHLIVPKQKPLTPWERIEDGTQEVAATSVDSKSDGAPTRAQIAKDRVQLLPDEEDQLAATIFEKHPRRTLQAKLILFMKGKSVVPFVDIDEGIYGDKAGGGERIEKLVSRTNATLMSLESRIHYSPAGEYVSKVVSPN